MKTLLKAKFLSFLIFFGVFVLTCEISRADSGVPQEFRYACPSGPQYTWCPKCTVAERLPDYATKQAFQAKFPCFESFEVCQPLWLDAGSGKGEDAFAGRSCWQVPLRYTCTGPKPPKTIGEFLGIERDYNLKFHYETYGAATVPWRLNDAPQIIYEGWFTDMYRGVLGTNWEECLYGRCPGDPWGLPWVDPGTASPPPPNSTFDPAPPSTCIPPGPPPSPTPGTGTGSSTPPPPAQPLVLITGDLLNCPTGAVDCARACGSGLSSDAAGCGAGPFTGAIVESMARQAGASLVNDENVKRAQDLQSSQNGIERNTVLPQ